jgi:hypothetical protein
MRDGGEAIVNAQLAENHGAERKKAFANEGF